LIKDQESHFEPLDDLPVSVRKKQGIAKMVKSIRIFGEID